jgi:hypothetical protein
VRVRTYGFPGCFTRPPGTSTRHHPHEPTTSKPVVPGDACLSSVAGRSSDAPRTDRDARQTTAREDGSNEKAERPRAAANEKRRGPGPLEEPTGSGPKAFLRGWRGLTPRWPRSLRLGSASSSKVALSSPNCNPLSERLPARSGKNLIARPCVPAIASRIGSTRRLRAGALRQQAGIGQRPSVLPQWSHGHT